MSLVTSYVPRMSLCVITMLAPWRDGSQTRAAGSARRRWSSTPSAATSRPPSPRSPSAPALTARTFFRYFADKREVLFSGSELLAERLVAALDAAPASATPLGAVAAALDVVAELIGDDRDHSRRRQVRHRRERRTAGTRADQDRHVVTRPRRRAAPPRGRRARREPRRPGRSRGLPRGVRAVVGRGRRAIARRHRARFVRPAGHYTF